MAYGKQIKRKSKVVLIWSAVCFASLGAAGLVTPVQAQDKPNIVIIWGDDIGISNLSTYSEGLMGYAYDRESHVGTLDKALDRADAMGWIIVDMKKDWKSVLPAR